MRIIVSPAKKMRVDTDSFTIGALPRFLPMSAQLLRRLREMTYEELRALWQCSEQIAALNVQRLRDMELTRDLTPTILSYAGIQYQYMAPAVFTGDELAYVEEHLRILSGFYGVLRPFDGVTPYRLEMQAKISIGQAEDLYEYWADSIAESIFAETDCIVNLASKEYSRCVSRYLRPGKRLITCFFGDWKEGQRGGRIVEKGTMCKMARGEMVRFLAENGIENPEEMRAFDRLNYRFLAERSNADEYIFVREPPHDSE